MIQNGISVIMPTYRQASFIRRAIKSLLNQTVSDWELLIIDDGSDDGTYGQIIEFLNDPRIMYFKNAENNGLGACLNFGISKAKNPFIAYLPSDDIMYSNHLESLLTVFIENKHCVLTYSGMKCKSGDFINNRYGILERELLENEGMQLVQVLHVKSKQRWIEREELVTDDLDVMYWNKLKGEGSFIGTGLITCEWTDQPHQRHKKINVFYNGSIYEYKRYYQVNKSIVFQSKYGNIENEFQYYGGLEFDKKLSKRKYNILLVGDLSYNPERIMAFEEMGHKLYAFWSNDLSNHTSVGSFPFGNIESISAIDWQSKIERIKPDLIFFMSNYHSIKTAHQVLTKFSHIPCVFNIKEGPFDAIKNGDWDKLIDLIKFSQIKIFHNELIMRWYSQFLEIDKDSCFIMDGELPRKQWFTFDKSDLLSDYDDEIHTVFVGRPFGLNQEDLLQLISQKIHLHFYGETFHKAYWNSLLNYGMKADSKYIHLHSHCNPQDWVKEFSKYDAGWLHMVKSENENEINKASWYDLNSPARIASYAIAGVPLIQYNNTGHLVYSQDLVKQNDIGVFLNSIEEAYEVLSNRRRMKEVRDKMWDYRLESNYDDKLNDLFKKIDQMTFSGS